MNDVRMKILLVGAAALAMAATPAMAQDNAEAADDATTPSAEDANSGGIEEILVTARKKSRAESLQKVPIAITALGPQQIEDAQLVTLADLGSRAPNVQTSANGTFGGVANFSIRGLAVNASIPSLEPAVGTFVDGVYLGTNFGVILDTFDLEAVEVLRGPQGTLQGRNVTGGAVMIRTRRPGDVLSMRGMVSYETGPAYTAAASVDGPIFGDILKGKVTGYYRNDEGWFHNDFNDQPVGKSRTWFVRPALTLSPNENFNVTAIYERGGIVGDGSVTQNGYDPTLTGFELNYDQPGYLNLDWEAVTAEANLDVGFGNGTITNIYGARRVLQDTLIDLDASADPYFDAYSYLKQRQISNELRYAGTFGPVDLTVGLFYFEQHYTYLERRKLLGGAIDRVFGGVIDQDSFAVFAQGDIELTPRLSATLGLRYSTEKKAADIDQSPSGLGASNCVYETKSCPFSILPEFKDSKRWNSLTPKVSLNWQATDELLLYASWSQGVRSGGYNVRSTSVTVPPGPFDMERQNAFELGYKADLFDRHVRFNGAAFLNKMSDLQRDVIFLALPPEVGTVQVIRNAVDANIYGAEGELVVLPSRYFRLEASVGYTGADYHNVRFDLNQDGTIDAADKVLKPPRLVPWTYAVGATYTLPIGMDNSLRFHIDYGYRSKMFTNDANTVSVRSRDMLDGFVEFSAGDHLKLSLYGKNLLNQARALSTTIVAPDLYKYTPLDRGRVIGVSLKTNF